MRVRIVACDTMGVRSLATFIETSSGVTLFIDPGAALAPRRFGLPPHPCEEARLEEALGEIRRLMMEAQVAVITHYHYDHYLYRSGEEEYYHSSLRLLVKNPASSINRSQSVRASRLLKSVADRVASVEYADGRVFEFEDVRIVFSPPYPHGEPGSPLGYVAMVLVEADGVRIIHASDVQGPGDRRALEWILAQRPDLVIISGPPLYLDENGAEGGLRNLRELVSRLPRGSTLVVDHHFVRGGVPVELSELRVAGSARGVKVVTCAEFMGLEPRVLESLRRELWAGKVKC